MSPYPSAELGTAKAVEGRHPPTAVPLRRAMVEDTPEGAKATRYRHAARHLLEGRAPEAGIGERGGVEPHRGVRGGGRGTGARRGSGSGWRSPTARRAGGEARPSRPGTVAAGGKRLSEGFRRDAGRGA